jgi:hypothetical protein
VLHVCGVTQGNVCVATPSTYMPVRRSLWLLSSLYIGAQCTDLLACNKSNYWQLAGLTFGAHLGLPLPDRCTTCPCVCAGR